MARNLLYINCTPWSSPSEQEWTEWLIKEHIPALLNSKAVAQVALYREFALAMLPEFFHPLRYLLLYRTPLRHVQDSERYKTVCQQTGALQGPASDDESETRNYDLIQEYDLHTQDDEPSPHILTVEMNPQDLDDFEDWYRTDLLPRISKLKGYRRSRRYGLAMTGKAQPQASRYLAVHEIQDLDDAFPGPEQHDKNASERTKMHIEASEQTKGEQGSGFVRRGWELMHMEGDLATFAASDADGIDDLEKPRRERAGSWYSISGLRRLSAQLWWG